MAVLQPVVQAEPRDELARQFLRNSLSGRGRANASLGQWAAVAADFGWCASLSAVPAEHNWFVEQRAIALVRAGEIETAVTEAEALGAKHHNATRCVVAARVFAIAAVAVAAEQRENYCDRAMAFLQQAVQAGLREPSRLQADSDFAPLHDREDFRRLVGGQR